MRSRWWSAALVLVASGAAATTPVGPARAAVNFSGVATADAARVTVVVPNAPATSSVVDTGVTSAQAVVTSAGTSQAYGSNPYPGDVAVSLPGTLAGFGAGGIPAYPLYAASRHPNTPEAEIGQGPFRLAAASTATSSEGSATSGVAGEQNALLTSAVTAVRQEPDGSVISAAESKVQGFVAGPLQIASIVSSSMVKLPADGGALDKAASLDVTGITVNDIAVKLTADGLVVGDQTVPAEGAAVADALAQAGVSISYIAPQELPNGILAAGLRVSSPLEIPGNTPGEAVWMFGRTLALIDAAQVEAGLPEVREVDSPAPVGGSEPAPAPPQGSAEPAPAQPPPPLPAAGAAVGPAPASAAARVGAFTPTAGVSSPAVSSVDRPNLESPAPPLPEGLGSDPSPESAPQSEAALVPDRRQFETAASLPEGDESGVYLLFVAGAAALFVIAQGFGLAGVRGK